MKLVRRLVLSSLHFNNILRAKHIPGKSIADLLSRLQFQKAYTTAPWLATTKTTIPPHLFNIESLKHRPCCSLLSPAHRENLTITVGNYCFHLCEPTPPQIPLSISNVCNFIAVLFERGYSPSTILSHVLALSYAHTIRSVFFYLTSTFLVRKMIKGCENLHTNKESRLPITKDILAKMLNSLDICIVDYNIRILLGAVFLLAFGAFLRLGEILVRSSQNRNKVVQLQDVQILYDNGKPVNLVLTLRHYKTIKHNRPITISLSANTQQPDFCPMTAMHKYLSIFKPQSGPLFQFIQGTSVNNKFITDKLSFILRFLGINPQFYKGHSFRIDAAIHAANIGFSEFYIRKLGRWNSTAVNQHIRINTFKL